MPMDYLDIATGKTSSQRSYADLAQENALLRKNLADIDAVIVEILLNQSVIKDMGGILEGGDVSNV